MEYKETASTPTRMRSGSLTGSAYTQASQQGVERMSGWRQERAARDARIEAGRAHASGKIVKADRVVDLLEAVLRPGDRVCLEGDNQKQADCLARGLSQCDPARIHDLHMVQSGIVLPEHLDIFEQG